MKLSTILVLVGLAFSVLALPLQKRISQQSQASTAPFLGACFAANGGSSCSDVANFSFGSLHAGGSACQQQEGGDRMIDLAKKLGNNTEMIRLAQIFVQQPRSSPDSLSELYCTQPPRNAELAGYYQCQFATENLSEFENESPSQPYQVGAPGTIPFGLSGPVTPPGSCPAHPDGPIPDGQQLVDLVQSPGIPAVGQGAAGSVVSSGQPSTPSTLNRFGLPTGVAWNKGAVVPYATAAPVPYSA